MSKQHRVLDWLTFFGSVGLLIAFCVGVAFLLLLRFRHYIWGTCP